MGILGIENRTENWKTARVFSPFFEDRSIALAERLLKGLGEPSGVEASKIRLELFWYGMRDHIHMRHNANPIPKNKFEERYKNLFEELYNRLFSDLRRKIEDFGKLEALQPCNYCVSGANQKWGLYNNLRHTEIDIVLETPNHLFVGEAKHKSILGYNSSNILAHQLIRQHVMAKILIEICDSKKEVTHFLVGDKDKLNEPKFRAMIEFMEKQEWLKKGNVLCWDTVKKLTQPRTS